MTQKDDEQKNLTDHEYDGIREYDYQLPTWWLNLFYASIVFAAGYFIWYQWMDGRSIQEEYQAEKAKLDIILANEASKSATVSEADLLALVKEPAQIKAGKEVFQNRCAVCHGAQGQGLIGPNLTDEYWLHGGKLAQIAQTVTNGIPEKGMPPWGPLLTPQQIHSVVAYIRSIRGSNPPNAKAAQGELYKE
ncbi:MAG: cbb3-type cytochrome c oxidase N-terminal domain-containing protein [Oligoflexia bacterium]|nr:cbb3-type cytochrome c oxidase N-terminal domain-containing protein [Oligoflexia bacterium]